MKSSRGISVLALAITVIVMIIITSITVYNGVSVITDARKKDANDKLATICNSLRKDDSFLEFADGTTETILTEADYIALDLKEYYDEDYPVKLKKTITANQTERVITYYLEMFNGEVDDGEVYTTKEFTIDVPSNYNSNSFCSKAVSK